MASARHVCTPVLPTSPPKKNQANVEKLIVRRSVAHPSLTRTIPRAGFHDAGQFSVADPQSIMELYCADEIAPIDRDQTCRGAPRARPTPSITHVVLGSHYPIIADARAGRRDGGARREGGPMTDPTTAITVVPDIKNDPADSRKAKVKAGAPSLTRARRARARGPKQARGSFFSVMQFLFSPVATLTQVTLSRIAACQKFVNLSGTHGAADTNGTARKRASPHSAGHVGRRVKASGRRGRWSGDGDGGGGDAARVEPGLNRSWHGSDSAHAVRRVTDFRSAPDLGENVVDHEVQRAAAAPSSILAVLDCIDGGFTPKELASGDGAGTLKRESQVDDSTEPARRPTKPSPPIGILSNLEAPDGSSHPASPAEAKKVKERTKSNLGQAKADDAPENPPDAPENPPTSPLAASSPAAFLDIDLPADPSAPFRDVRVELKGTCLDEVGVYLTEKEKALSMKHARQMGILLANRTFDGTLHQAEDIHRQTAEMWKDVAFVIHEHNVKRTPGLQPSPPPAFEPPRIQVSFETHGPDDEFEVLDDKYIDACDDAAVPFLEKDQCRGDVRNVTTRASQNARDGDAPDPNQTGARGTVRGPVIQPTNVHLPGQLMTFKDAMDTLEFLSPDDHIEAALDHHEREVYFS